MKWQRFQQFSHECLDIQYSATLQEILQAIAVVSESLHELLHVSRSRKSRIRELAHGVISTLCALLFPIILVMDWMYMRKPACKWKGHKLFKQRL